MIDPQSFIQQLSRRTFIRRSAGGLGAAALASLLNPQLLFGGTATQPTTVPGTLGHTHFAPKAKRIIYLCQSGAPSQMELFDYKPKLDELRGTDLPAYVVMISRGSGRPVDQPLYDRLWGSGFLPSKHQGVKLRGMGDPVLYLSNPAGVDDKTRRRQLDDLAKLNQQRLDAMGDPEIATRIAQYELAYRMQTAVPELSDLSKEPPEVVDSYGPDARKRGTYAANCFLARRLSERGVRFVQLFHMGWDQHDDLPNGIRGQCRDTDQPSAALIKDLKNRGLLDDTLVIWAGEFGRTVYGQGVFNNDTYGRDHHPRCFSIWMAGGGIKGGITHGETDDF